MCRSRLGSALRTIRTIFNAKKDIIPQVKPSRVSCADRIRLSTGEKTFFFTLAFERMVRTADPTWLGAKVVAPALSIAYSASKTLPIRALTAR